VAVGIDRSVHRKLIESLNELSGVIGEDTWKLMLDELQIAYDRAINLSNLAMLSATFYNEMQTKIRIKVASEQRSRKRQLAMVKKLSKLTSK